LRPAGTPLAWNQRGILQSRPPKARGQAFSWLHPPTPEGAAQATLPYTHCTLVIPRSTNSTSTTGPCSSSSGVSMLGDADPAGVEAGLAELRRLFATECSLGTSVPGFGVSPPVRSGAANGLVHDSLWRQEAPRACKASLRALHERAGRGCLSACAGDYRLLMTSPDQGLHLLRGASEGDDAEVEPSTALSRSLASSRASPAATLGWHPAQSASPEPSDLFSY
jgi:hypothetical protein